MRNEEGFTLLESLIAMAILAIALVGMVPNFQAFLDANSASEKLSNALAAAQEAMETLRHQEPSSLPTKGSSAVQIIEVGQHEYEVVNHFCQKSNYCTTGARHIVVEVSFGGRVVYTVETVFSRLN